MRTQPHTSDPRCVPIVSVAGDLKLVLAINQAPSTRTAHRASIFIFCQKVISLVHSGTQKHGCLGPHLTTL